MKTILRHSGGFRLSLSWDRVPDPPVEIEYGSDSSGGHRAVLRLSGGGVALLMKTPAGEVILKENPAVPSGHLTMMRRGNYVRVRYDEEELWMQVGDWAGALAEKSDVLLDDPGSCLTGCDCRELSWLLPAEEPAIPCATDRPEGSFMEQQVLPGAILKENGIYYLYTICARKGEQEGADRRVIGLCTSDDLIHWNVREEPLIRLGELNIPHDNLYANACLKAPDGTFVLLMTVQKFPNWVGLCAFTAPSPEGPFTPYAGNPILRLDTPHHEFDAVSWNGPEGRYLLYLTAFVRDPADGRMGDRGIRFFSDDLLHWRRDEEDTLFRPETKNGWDAAHVRTRGLNYCEADGKWYLWYEGTNHWTPPALSSVSDAEQGFVNKEWWDTIGLARTADFRTWEYYPLNPCLNPTGISPDRFDSRWTGWPRMIVKDGVGYVFHSCSGSTVSVGCRTIRMSDLTDWESELR